MTPSPQPDYCAIFSALPGLYLILLPDDPKFTIVAVNVAYAAATNTVATEIVGRGIFEVFPDDPADRSASGVSNLHDSFRQVIQTRARHAMPTQKYHVRRPEHQGGGFEQRYWSPVNTPILDGNGNVQLLIHRVEDVTDLVRMRSLQEGAARTQSEVRAEQMEVELLLRARQFAESERILRERQEIEQRLLSIEARYSLAFARAPIGMVLLTPEGRILEVNQAYVDSLGFSREELVSGGSSAPFTHPDDVELTRQFFAGLREGSRDTSSIEKRYFRRDGKLLWTRASAAMRRDGNGNPVEVIAIVEDITERKYAEEQLRESQAHLRAIYDSTYEYIGLLSLDGILLNVNRAALEFVGSTLDKVRGLPFWDTPWFTGTPGAPEVIRHAIAAAATGQFVRSELALARPSGEVHTFDFSIHPVRNDRGEVIFLVPESRDITEKYRAARQIEEDRRRWRELFRQTPAAICILRGPHHVFEWVNPVYEELVDRPASRLLGHTAVEAVPEAAGQIYLELLDRVFRTGEPFEGHESPIRLERADGSSKDFFLNFVYLPTTDISGVTDGIFAHITDVTAAVLARKQIEESERQFRTLAETIPHLAWMADESGARFWYNRRWYDYTGSSLGQVQGQGWQQFVDAEYLPTVMRQWDSSLATGEPFEMVYPIRGAGGAYRSFLTRVEPVKDLAGRVVKWFGTNTDITAQLSIEEELRRTNRELEEFAYVASHDLQEPLRMVNIYTQKILRNPGASRETVDQYSAFVRQGVERMEALIHDLLTFSRTVNSAEAYEGAADLSAALAEALAVLENRIDESRAVIRAGKLPLVRGDTAQLAHVFQNVIANAIKYRASGVVPEVEINARRDGKQWVVAIRDNGIGFEPRFAERIFGLFKRLHKDEYPGTGLGLAICKRIIERYGGRMWAEAEPGLGATIYFALESAVSGE